MFPFRSLVASVLTIPLNVVPKNGSPLPDSTRHDIDLEGEISAEITSIYPRQIGGLNLPPKYPMAIPVAGMTVMKP